MPAHLTTNEAPHPRFLSILVTATDVVMADTISAMLNACGHATAQISDHVDGLRVMDSFVFDVLVISIDKSGSTGLAFALAAKAKRPGMRIVWISPHADMPTSLARSAVDAFLSMPFTIEQLNDSVRLRAPVTRF